MDAQIKSSAGKERKIQISFRELGLAERRKAALKGLGINWGISALCLPLPPIHWVATPFFFVFGFYWSRKKYYESSHIAALDFSCPECEKVVSFPDQPAKNSKEITCPHCRYLLRLTW